jgi:hypothetical protein
LIKILHNEGITEFSNVGDSVNVIGKVGAILEADPVSSGGNGSARQRGAIEEGILILQVVGL